MVWDFIANLGRQRVNSVQAAVKGKVYGAKAKARAKAAGKINGAVNGAAKKAKNKAKGAASKAQDKAKGSAKKDGGKVQKDEKGMGLFGRKKGGGRSGGAPAPEPEPEAAFGEKTQFIQVVQDERPKECVGWIVCLSGPLKGQDFRLVPGKNMIGTAADTDIVLTDQYMSSRHAVIGYNDGIFTLVDLDSTNGSFVNDEQVAKEELIDNDRLRLGRTELKFKSLY